MIEESENEILRRLMKALAVEINLHFNSKLVQINKIVREMLRQEVMASREWADITGADSKLRFQLGIVNAEPKMTKVLDQWIESVSVRLNAVRPSGKDFKGGIEIVAVPSDYADVLGLPDVITVTNKGQELNWLKWLLLDGGGVIVSGWHVLYKPGSGRTKGAIMVKKGSWSVPDYAAGDNSNNFITRAIQRIIVPMEGQIIQCLMSS
jgi:hypothetical protein